MRDPLVLCYVRGWSHHCSLFATVSQVTPLTGYTPNGAMTFGSLKITMATSSGALCACCVFRCDVVWCDAVGVGGHVLHVRCRIFPMTEQGVNHLAPALTVRAAAGLCRATLHCVTLGWAGRCVC